ncbi:hypothetical protein D3C80_1689780 [compost metagenome]
MLVQWNLNQLAIHGDQCSQRSRIRRILNQNRISLTTTCLVILNILSILNINIIIILHIQNHFKALGQRILRPRSYNDRLFMRQSINIML